MKRLLIATACLMALTTTNAFADNTCKSTKYKLIDNTVSFGMSQSSALSALRKKFSSKARIDQKMNFVFVNFRKPYNNLKMIVVLSREDKVTRLMFVYADEFAYSFGGSTELFKIMLKKMQDSYGDFSDSGYDQEDKKATIIWPKHNGASLTFMGSDKDGELSYRVDCDALEQEIKEKQKKSANFGF